MNIRSKWINYYLVMDHFSVPRLPNEDNLDSLKGAVTLGNFSCNLSRNFVAIQVARNIA